MSKILVTGAGGFIGHHLVRRLREKGHNVFGVDIKPNEYVDMGENFYRLDLRKQTETQFFFASHKFDEVYALAADMGGMGFIADSQGHSGDIIWNNAMINLNTMRSAVSTGVKKYLYTSSACVYPEFLQEETNIKPLKESDAFPAMPQDSYGWEKLFSEIALQHYAKKSGMDIRIVRFHNIYGPEGDYSSGREKAPAALIRKVIIAKDKGKPYIEIWGDGEQTRSFCHINDCLKGLELIMEGDSQEPINLGRDEMVSINQLANSAMKAGKVELEIKHITGPEGVRGRNSDNTMFKAIHGWTPEISLDDGILDTYKWMEEHIHGIA